MWIDVEKRACGRKGRKVLYRRKGGGGAKEPERGEGKWGKRKVQMRIWHRWVREKKRGLKPKNVRPRGGRGLDSAVSYI
jgi:hypothetical protein